MEFTNCIICDSEKQSDFQITNSNNSFTLVKCDCDFIYLNPRPDIKEIEEYYKKDNYFPHSDQKSFMYKFLRKISFNWKYRIVKSFFDNKNSNKILLDVGSGDGSFSKFIEHYKWKTFNYDLYTKNDNEETENKISDFSLDLITMWHSIEHIHDIDNVFNYIQSKLKKNGYLFIACPNIHASEIFFLKGSWVAYDLPRHIYHFTPETLELLINRYNFSIVKKYKMPQDTIFNVFESLNKHNVIIKLLLFLIISICSIFVSSLFRNRSSSYTYICKRK